VVVAEPGQRLLLRGPDKLRLDPDRCRADGACRFGSGEVVEAGRQLLCLPGEVERDASVEGCRISLAAASPATASGVAGGSPTASARWIHSCASRRCPVTSQNRCSAATERQADSMSPASMLCASEARRLGCSAASPVQPDALL
jgi:hypothetical protein